MYNSIESSPLNPTLQLQLTQPTPYRLYAYDTVSFTVSTLISANSMAQHPDDFVSRSETATLTSTLAL